jgi:hypothetical protein
MDINQFENNIKRNFLPYGSFLKLSKIGDYVDNVANIPYTPPVEDDIWKILESDCEYPDLMLL